MKDPYEVLGVSPETLRQTDFLLPESKSCNFAYYLPRFLLVWALSHAAARLWLRLFSAREDARALRMAVDGYAGRLAHLESRCAQLEEQIAQLSGQKDEK